MARHCVVKNCNTNSRVHFGAKFYKFPGKVKRLQDRKGWIKNVNRAAKCPATGKVMQWEPKAEDCVCFKHFVKGKPTVEYPMPEINMGHDFITPVRGRKPRKRCLEDPQADVVRVKKPKISNGNDDKSKVLLTPATDTTTACPAIPEESSNNVNVPACTTGQLCTKLDSSRTTCEMHEVSCIKRHESQLVNSQESSTMYADYLEDNTSPFCTNATEHVPLVNSFHTYAKDYYTSPSERRVQHYKKKAERLERQLKVEEDAKRDNTFVEKILQKSDEKTRQFTGFPTYKSFFMVFEKRVKRRAQRLATSFKRSKKNWTETTHNKKPGRQRKLALIDEFLLVMMRIRLGSIEVDLADRFGITTGQVSRIWLCWVPCIAKCLRKFIKWPTKDQVQKHMPSSFKKFRNARVIIDCTEIFIQKPTALVAKQETYSSYKHHNTAKILVGVTPEGGISFLSKAWGGRVSDKHITNNSGLLEKLEPHDTVMADRGFLIASELAQRCCTLNLPPFTRGKKQLSRPEVEKHRRISRLRIHVERTISRLKSFRILKTVYPVNQLYLLNDILTVCAAVVNLWPPMVRN